MKCQHCENESEVIRCVVCDGNGQNAQATDFELEIGPNNVTKYEECWNCDGVGLIRTTPFIKQLVSKNSPTSSG